MDKGILVNHYHCGNNEEKTTWKITKYACPTKGQNSSFYEMGKIFPIFLKICML